MNGKDLFLGLSYISRKYIEEAEEELLLEKKTSRKTISFRRPLLIAAVLALALLLVGCAVVYALRLQDMSIGKDTYVQSFDDKGKAMEPVEKTRDVVTLYGHSGDTIQQAMAEWYEFLEGYDTDHALRDNNPDHAEIPNQYEYTYGCYTTDMMVKVNEIAEKYNLKLLDERLPFQAWQSDIFLEETEIGSFLRDDSGAEIGHMAGMYFPPYNFSMEFELSAEQLDSKIWCSIDYARKDYFPCESPGGIDLSLFEQWDHTAPDGTPLLLALNNKGTGYIIAEPENAMMILYLYGNFSGSAYPEPEEILTKAEMEMIADLFDYSIQPQIADRAVIEKKLAEAEAAHNAANTFVEETYGSFDDYLKVDIQIYDDELQYCFYDLTGDGEKDLLIGRNGALDKCLYIQDGKVLFNSYGSAYVCENGILDIYSAYEIFEEHMYVTPNFITDPGDMDTLWENVERLSRTRQQWIAGDAYDSNSTREITPEEAQDIMDQYPRVTLDWMPLMEYPLSEGYTVGSYLEEKDVRVSDEELMDIYRNYLSERDSSHYSHYRVLDINGDGVDDLLLKGENDSLIGNTDFYWIALTYRYGMVAGFESDFYLCEEGILEKVSTRYTGGFGVEVDGHQFKRCIGFDDELYEFVAYNKATASWQGDWWNEIPLEEEVATAILAKYPRIDQGMRPISELMG